MQPVVPSRPAPTGLTITGSNPDLVRIAFDELKTRYGQRLHATLPPIHGKREGCAKVELNLPPADEKPQGETAD